MNPSATLAKIKTYLIIKNKKTKKNPDLKP
jgi:hypothetical protein